MTRAVGKYRLVYAHLWRTYGASWPVRISFLMVFAVRIAKLVLLPVAVSIVIAHLSVRDFDGAYQGVWLFVSGLVAIAVLAPLSKIVGMRGENVVYRRDTGEYFSRLVHADLDYFHSNLAGYLTTATRQYVDSTINLVRTLRDQYMMTVLSVLLPLVIIMWVDLWLGLVALLVTIIQAGYMIWASRAITPLRAKARETYKTNSGRMADIISNILAVRSTAQEEAYIEGVRNGSTKEADIFKQRYTMQAKLNAVRECISVVFFVALLWLVIVRTGAGAIDIGVAVLVATYIFTIHNGIYTLADNLDAHDDFIDKIIPAFEILNRQNQITDPARPKALKSATGAVRFDAVGFAYDDGHPVLRDFSLDIPAGQKVGVVGLSGAGKSTLTKLLLRFNDVTDGAVRLDDIDVRRVRQIDLRRQIAYVPQEPLLFHDTIKANILVANPQATDKDVERALKLAHAHEFVRKLPEGLESIVGERGVKLSGGQKQRIAIARAVLREAPIMILDEATSALDSESEQIIKDSFAQILKGKTALVVAHRLSTLSEMDRIVVIEKGRVIEDDTHAELLAQQGAYAKLWRRQQRHADEPALESDGLLA